MSALFDWLNDNPWLILLACLLALCLRCSSVDRADTVRLQERAEATLEQLDKAEKECQSVDCKEAIKQTRQLVKDSLATLSNKDSEIAQIQDEAKENEIYTDIGRFIVWGLGLLLLAFILYTFRDQIMSLIKLVL